MVSVDIRNTLVGQVGPEHGLTMEEVARLADDRPGDEGALPCLEGRPAFLKLARQTPEELGDLSGRASRFAARHSSSPWRSKS